jgi:hypothetical protein
MSEQLPAEISPANRLLTAWFPISSSRRSYEFDIF